MGKWLFTVLPVYPDAALLWAEGILPDKFLFNWLVQPECEAFTLVIARVDGRAAGMRALFAWLRQVDDLRNCQGFAMRTRLAAVERVFQRFGGRMTFDEGDGDRRWFAPAAPGVAWLLSDPASISRAGLLDVERSSRAAVNPKKE